MALNNNDCREILKDMRSLLSNSGFGGMDERILSELQGSDSPFYDLSHYLKLLIDDIALGGDEQVRNVLRRVRSSVETDSGKTVDGVEIELSPEESERYGIKKLMIGPDAAMQEIVVELRSILDEIKENYLNNNSPDSGMER